MGSRRGLTRTALVAVPALGSARSLAAEGMASVPNPQKLNQAGQAASSTPNQQHTQGTGNQQGQ